jgi:hypothetical protein
VPVEFGFRDVLTVGARLASRGTLPFELSGDLKVNTPFGSVTRAFQERGDYDGVNVSILPRRR